MTDPIKLHVGNDELPEEYHHTYKHIRYDADTIKALREKRDLLMDEHTEELIDLLHEHLVTLHTHTGFGMHAEQDVDAVHPDSRRTPGESGYKAERNAANLDSSLEAAQHARETLEQKIRGMPPCARRTQLATELGRMPVPAGPGTPAVPGSGQLGEIANRQASIAASTDRLWRRFCYYYNCPDGIDPATAGRPNATPTREEMNGGNMDIKLAYLMATEHRAPIVGALGRMQDLSHALAGIIPGFTPPRSFVGLRYDELISIASHFRAARDAILEKVPRERTGGRTRKTTWPLRESAPDAERDKILRGMRGRAGDIQRRRMSPPTGRP
ncbi:hypothetical protein AUJ14_00525 [Candidatus Micrarchaeota archaeon CG1_02_55_22]|nr:MAG: hypothetical protein AUJ14_00525 [Candidatus Micrarchaeota archaeon CG1_02_55_22]